MLSNERIAEIKRRKDALKPHDDALVPGGGVTLDFNPAGVYPITDNDGTRDEPCEATVWYDDGDLCAEVHGNLALGLDGDNYAEFFANSISDVSDLLEEREELVRKTATKCLWIAEGERLVDSTGDGEDDAYNMAVKHIADAIRKEFSLPVAPEVK